MKIAIAVALSKQQYPDWWGQLVHVVHQLDKNPHVTIGSFHFVGSAMTDFNRNEIVKGFLAEDYGSDDGLWFLDDDTIPDTESVLHLIKLDAPVANGTYFLRSGKHEPLAYMRHPSGMYMFLGDFVRGEIAEVDSVGMGNTLIRRYVFEEIMDQYVVYQHLHKRTMYPVHKDDITDAVTENITVPQVVHERAPMVLQGPGRRGYMVEPLVGPVDFEDPNNEDLKWPFFGMEVGRTEDHWFNEMVRRCGFDIVSDTWNEARHIGTRKVDSSDWRATKARFSRARELQYMPSASLGRG